MTQKPIRNLRTRLQSLPDPITRLSHFLVWRHEWSDRRQRMVKTPYYVSGQKRFGALGTPKDLRKLTDLEEAIDTFENSSGFYDGIGLALVGDGTAAFDLDKCLTPDGELIPDHAGRYIAERAEAEGAYIEISPSGTGLRILGPCLDPTAYSRNGVEYWGEGRYVTLTGSVWANPKGWRDMTALRETLPSRDREESQGSADDEEDTLITRRVLDELRSALSAMSSDERDLWIRMGHALKTVGSKGKELWLEWSAKSDKFNEEDAEATWDSFRPDHTNYKAVFAEAQKEWGWENPRSGKSEAQDEEEPANLLDYALDLGAPVLYPTEFVLDGFLPTGVSLIAGAWGAGKSTNLIPLFASVAHLTPEDWGFHPVLRRHVVWITEAPDQARDTIYSIVQADGSATWGQFKEWFHLVPARRVSPKSLAKQVKEAVAALTYTLDNGFAVRPVVILDTVSANLDLENESDNSEVGAAMSRLKEALPGVPLVLVGHTPKAITKGDVSEMTFRGAGAWEADAVATYFLVHDPETSMRFMALGKVRFTPDYNEISFGQEGGRELVETQWGDPQSKAYIHGIPAKSTGQERKEAQMKVKEEKAERKKERDTSERQARILEAVTRAADEGSLMTPTRLQETIGSRGELVTEAINRLIEAGHIRTVPLSEEVVRVGGWKGKRIPSSIYLPTEVDSVDFFDRFLEENQ